MDFAIARANHENNRENYRGFNVPDLPQDERAYRFFDPSSSSIDRLEITSPSKSLLSNLEEKSLKS